ncbi:MAG TPA: cyanophycin synthetase, partial [Treponemataceae bacterium]|nr:cyanophycin synthetase [Treponemataceae bacterium]
LLTFKNPIQLQNAALSALAVKYLFPDLEETVIASGLSKAWLPGRFEIIRNNPLVVLDGAHTVSSITLTRDAFSSVSTKPARLLFACAADKNVERMAEILCPFFTSITLTRPGDRKESDLGHTETAFKQVISTMDDEDTDNRPALEIEENFEKAIRKVWDASAKEATPLLVTGSFYLVAEMKRILSSQL